MYQRGSDVKSYERMAVWWRHHFIIAAEVMRDAATYNFCMLAKINTLQVADDQELNGVDMIKLAGCGSLYVKQNESMSAYVDHKSAELVW